jgi:hypothetical protein
MARHAECESGVGEFHFTQLKCLYQPQPCPETKVGYSSYLNDVFIIGLAQEEVSERAIKHRMTRHEVTMSQYLGWDTKGELHIRDQKQLQAKREPVALCVEGRDMVYFLLSKRAESCSNLPRPRVRSNRGRGGGRASQE